MFSLDRRLRLPYGGGHGMSVRSFGSGETPPYFRVRAPSLPLYLPSRTICWVLYDPALSSPISIPFSVIYLEYLLWCLSGYMRVASE